MSVYRDPANRRGRRLLIVAVLASLLVGALGGFLIARATEDEPTIEEQFAEVQSDLRPAISALELVPGHYEQGVRDGEVVEPAQYEGARAQAAAAADSLAEVAPDLVVVAPEEAQAAEERIGELQGLIEELGALEEVERSAGEARDAVAAAAGLNATDTAP
jgi:hypothetical protein